MKTPPDTNGKLLEISANNTISKEIKENTYKLVSSDTCIITYMTSFDATKTRIIEQKCIVNESKITPTWTIHNTFTNTKLKLCHYKRFRTFYNILFCCHRLQFWQDGRGPTVLLWLSADTKSRSTTSKFIIMFCLPFSRRQEAHVRERQPSNCRVVKTWNTPYVIFSLRYYFARKILQIKVIFLLWWIENSSGMLGKWFLFHNITQSSDN